MIHHLNLREVLTTMGNVLLQSGGDQVCPEGGREEAVGGARAAEEAGELRLLRGAPRVLAQTQTGQTGCVSALYRILFTVQKLSLNPTFVFHRLKYLDKCCPPEQLICGDLWETLQLYRFVLQYSNT